MQRALLPRAYRGAFFEAAGTAIPCRAIAGDFFEYVGLPSGELAFALCDVAGKGASAALLSGVLQGILSVEASLGDGPATTVSRVGRALARRAIDSRFATMFYGILSSDGRLSYCNAGHNPPFLLGRNRFQRLRVGGFPLGLFERGTYEEETIALEPQDLLVVFSDGLPDALNVAGEEFGEERLLSVVAGNQTTAPPQLLDSLFTAIHQFSRGAAQPDDMTALVLRYAGQTARVVAEKA